MNQSEYFHDMVETYMSLLSDRALNAGVDVVRTLIVFDTATPYTQRDY